MTKEEKRIMFRPHKWGLYENGCHIATYNSKNAAKCAKHRAEKDAALDWLDLDYEIRRED